MGLLDRVSKAVSLVLRGEGDYSPGPWYLPVSNGWLSAEAGANWNWWQLGYNVESLSSPSALVEACISAYAQTVAQCPGDHWLTQPDGGRKRQTNSALYRILRQPNSYQTISDFLLNAVRCLYSDGNAYALALRNSRYEISELHLMNPRGCGAIVAETGDVFYALTGNSVLDSMVDFNGLAWVPQRDVLHLKLNASPYNPLRGTSPIESAAMDIAAGNAIMKQQVSFYLNQARPSSVLATDLNLNKQQVDELRLRWDEQVKGLKSGGTPILTQGLKPVPLSINSVDSQLAEVMKLTREDIALAFRIPMQVLGIAGGAPLGSTEALMNTWLNQSLGFCLNHVETAFDRLFALKGQPDEYTEFDTSVLLRSNFRDRIDGLVRGVQGGVLSPNEARAKEGYGRVEAGDEPRVQQQLVPLSAADLIQPAPGPAASPAAAGPVTQPTKDFADGTRVSGRVSKRRGHELRAKIGRVRASG